MIDKLIKGFSKAPPTGALCCAFCAPALSGGRHTLKSLLIPADSLCAVMDRHLTGIGHAVGE